MITYRVFGEPRGPHYAHYDLVGGRYVCVSCFTPFVFFPCTSLCYSLHAKEFTHSRLSELNNVDLS